MPVKSIQDETFRHRLHWLLGFFTLLFLIIWLTPPMPVGQGLKSYAPLHAILEIFSVVISGAIFTVGWHGRVTSRTDWLAIVASGFLGVALLDVAHLLSYTGMPDWVTPSGASKAINFWFAARYLAAFSLMALVLVSRKRKKNLESGTGWILLTGVLLLTALTIWVVLGHPDLLPVFLIPNQGLTPTKIAMEWVLVLLTVSTLFLVLRNRKHNDSYDTNSLVAALWLTILSELCFTLYSNTADIFNLMGHIYKVLSYAFLYHALVVGSVKLPYKLLSESQQTLQQLTDNIRQVFWMTTGDQKHMLYVSPAYEMIWQRSCRSLLEEPDRFFDSIHPDDRSLIHSIFPNTDTEGKSIEYRIIRPDHSERWIRSRAFPIHDANGEVWRIAGVAEDITEELEASKELNHKQTLLQHTQAIAQLGSWEYEPSKDNLIWSDEVYRIFGFDSENFTPNYKSFLETVYPDDRDKVNQRYLDSLKNSEDNYDLEHRIIRHDNGETRYVYEKCHHVRNEQGDVVRSIGMVHDITEQKHAEQDRDRLMMQLTQAQKMEAIGQLTGGIAHDFNNILAAINGFAELLQLSIGSGTTGKKEKQYVNEILMAGNRAKELIAQMLVFSRLKKADEEDEIPVIQLPPVIEEVTHLLHSSIPSTISIDFHFKGDVSAARIQPVQLHQILLNLAINARDAIGEYGKIDINISQREHHRHCDGCHESFSGEYIKISVSDTGSGIPKVHKSDIFNPFFTTKVVGKGTGMGLSVVHGIVHSLGGHVGVTSDHHTGTTISIFLPVAENTQNVGEASITQKQDSHNNVIDTLSILIVDDERALTAMLKEFLAMRGARAETYNDPLTAMEKYKQDPQAFDLIITDETMPGLTGLDMATQMLALNPELQIILCTGYSDKVNAATARERGIAGYMDKPINLQNLLKLIQELFNKKQAEQN